MLWVHVLLLNHFIPEQFGPLKNPLHVQTATPSELTLHVPPLIHGFVAHGNAETYTFYQETLRHFICDIFHCIKPFRIHYN